MIPIVFLGFYSTFAIPVYSQDFHLLVGCERSRKRSLIFSVLALIFIRISSWCTEDRVKSVILEAWENTFVVHRPALLELLCGIMDQVCSKIERSIHSQICFVQSAV